MRLTAQIFLCAWLAVSDLDRGLALFHQREFGKAEQVFRHVLARQPGHSTARLHLSRVLMEQGRIAEALAQVEHVLGAQAEPEARFQAGAILRELAQKRADQLAKVAPGSAAVHEMSGERLEREGKLAEALKQYRVALDKEPARLGIHYRLGSVLWKQHELDAAAEALKAELAHAPHHGMANLLLGEVLIAKSAEGNAVEHLERAVAAMPESMEAKRELGKAFRKLGRSADARRVWEQVARLRPDDRQIHFLLGGLYRDLGEMELARREMERHRVILGRK